MPSPPAVRGVGIPVGAGSYADAPQSPPAFLRLAPETAQSDFSGIDAASAQNTQFNFQTQYALENQPTAGACPSYPAWPATSSSPATLNAQNPAAEPAYIIPEGSSHTHRGSLASLVSEDSFPFPSSPGSQNEFVSGAPLFHGLASPDTPSQIAGSAHPQQPSSSAPGVSRQKRRTGTRKRNPNPKDPKAAQRLQEQRQMDDQDLAFIFERLVPSSVGTVETVAKKDRLHLSTF
jgi:hypothetical protein